MCLCSAEMEYAKLIVLNIMAEILTISTKLFCPSIKCAFYAFYR